MPTYGATTDKGFFGSLFDYSFTSFITLRFLKVIYAILVFVILLGGLIGFASGLAQGRAFGMLIAFVGAPLLTLFWLVLVRVSLESVAMFFRIGQNTSVLAGAAAVSGGAPDGPAASPLGHGAPPPPSGHGALPPHSGYGPAAVSGGKAHSVCLDCGKLVDANALTLHPRYCTGRQASTPD